MVLATDMSVHFKYLAKLKAKFLPPAADKRVEPRATSTRSSCAK